MRLRFFTIRLVVSPRTPALIEAVPIPIAVGPIAAVKPAAVEAPTDVAISAESAATPVDMAAVAEEIKGIPIGAPITVAVSAAPAKNNKPPPMIEPTIPAIASALKKPLFFL